MEAAEQNNIPQAVQAPKHRQRIDWLWELVLLWVMIAAAYFRFSGLLWGDFQYLHPDERFFVWVTADMSPVKSLAEYFNTAVSTLNPHNVGHGFFVYGTLPVIAARYIVDWVYQTATWEHVLIVGRTLAASMDLITVLLVFLIGERLFNRKVGVLAAAFSSVAVMQIQQAHFFTSDSFATTFSVLAVYFAVCLSQTHLRIDRQDSRWWWLRERFFHYSLAFGAAVGVAMACKINTAPVAFLLPAAIGVHYLHADQETRRSWLKGALYFLVGGGAVALLVFRILQPYAFSGPGFFGLTPNPLWISNLKELAAQSSGDVDMPPALQWARRSITFSFQNMVVWGMGIPFAIAAWAGFLWLGWRMIKGEWPKTVLFWGWTAAYFLWQSLQGNPTMRYQLPIYPLLAVMAAWAILELGQKAFWSENRRASMVWRISAWAGGILALGLTVTWAYAFLHIYIQPMTRVVASDWIYENVPGPVNLLYADGDVTSTQPLPYNPQLALNAYEPVERLITAQYSGDLTQISLGTVQDLLNITEGLKTVQVAVQSVAHPEQSVYGQITDLFSAGDTSEKVVTFTPALTIEAGGQYRMVIALLDEGSSLSMSGRMKWSIADAQGQSLQMLAPSVDMIRGDQPQEIIFTPASDGQVSGLNIAHLVDSTASTDEKTLEITVYALDDRSQPLTKAVLTGIFNAADDPRGQTVQVTFDSPLQVSQEQTYILHFDLIAGSGGLSIYGSAPANETSWDDGLPIRRGNYDGYGGIYEANLNFEMYYDDDQAKLERFEQTLDTADYLFISSNRQWGTTTRLQERYPLTTKYYRELMGCPAEESILDCYRRAEVGMFDGQLGFELVKVFESYPTLGTLKINDQYAEEAFTVYDHPKVLIFKKTAAYNAENAAKILESVDLSTAMRVLPGQAATYPENLMLPDDRLAEQQAGGTWSDYFSYDNPLNAYPALGLLVWYSVITLLGWACYPLVRIALHGLSDKGFPFVKITGMLLLSWMVWFASSTAFTFTRPVIWAAVLLILLVNGILAWRQWPALRRDLRQQRRYFLTVEAVGLAFFAFFLLIRFANPDLWHPSFGGEKPMDFAYFNAVLKSTTFPAYNPWLSGGYINYYYYGFVLVGVPTKWLGIVPSIAYNLILPTLASLLALGAFSVAWNLVVARQHALPEDPADAEFEEMLPLNRQALWAGVGAAAAMIVIGNLGTIRQIWHGLMKLAAPNGSFDGANIFSKIGWTFQGLGNLINGGRLPYSTGDWYWIPSRALPGGGAITEFPFFTFLYADPHAHLFAMALTVLALGWAVSVVLRQWDWAVEGIHPLAGFGLSIFLGALAVFVLRPTNTWDFPTYLLLAIVAIVYAGLRYAPVPQGLLPQWPLWVRRLLLVTGVLIIFYIVGTLLFKPYTDWYALGYSKIDLWNDEKSDFASYFTHWGLFLVIIVTWMTTLTVEWMAKTPLSALNKLLKAKIWIYIALAVYVGAVVFLAVRGVSIGWFVFTLMVWDLALLLKPDQPDAQRIVLLLIGGALSLTLAVEVIVLVGDIGRMNTVFKFYLQAWILLSLSAALSMVWLLPRLMMKWKGAWKNVWVAVVSVLAFSACLYTIMAGSAKMRDRMSVYTPAGLDGSTYMQTSVYYEHDHELDLNQDYKAIRWMQENVSGSPTIVEAQLGTYRWGSRYSINTGLPTVLGWDWHEIQQRSVVGDSLVNNRASAVNDFYNTTDRSAAQAFLQKYGVKYIIVGELEAAIYDATGVSKFAALEGDLWRAVYQDGDTTIYEVIQ
ncbi:MAG TPA: DUF2298 domain-containing protein [Bellilinea sp.]|nr:DUF2298 domain-containing protein [Bellilinea sp.]